MSASKHHIIALLVAAGRGIRAGLDGPKQYASLAGETVLARSLRAFLAHKEVDAVSVAIHKDDTDLYAKAIAHLPPDMTQERLLPPTIGGATRQDSVRLGLEHIAHFEPKKVLIHDAARPLVSAATISAVIAQTSEKQGALAAIPATDTLKFEDTTYCSNKCISRDNLWRASTPQSFPFAAMLAAHRAKAAESFTDDAAIASAVGLPVKLVPDNPENIKITRKEDFAMAEKLLAASSEARMGHGYDVHAFGPGDRVILCGVTIPHERGLIGHSDADVALHAITDALLGTIGAGDIGSHFPPSDPKWKGAPSQLFMENARDRIKAMGGRIIHVDVTIICEMPKIGPHREAMRARIGKILGIEVARVSVKATTTEGLGFTGRKEGIAAMATANIALPAPGLNDMDEG